MPDLEIRIDHLYQIPLPEFVTARTALAAELTGADQQRVKQLKKPTVVSWAVNQVYWHARAAFDRAQRSGDTLRRAQVDALRGRSVDLRGASDEHRAAVAAATVLAVRFADAARLRPNRDAVARTLDALTLAAKPPAPPGQLTEPLQPGGFEMLAGVPVKAARETERQARTAEALRRESEAAARRHASAIKKAEAAAATLRDKESDAKRAWERIRESLQKAERTLVDLRSSD